MAQRKKWDPERMTAAIEATRNKEMGSYKAFRVFSVPQTTLEHYIKDWEKSSNEAMKTKLGRKHVLQCEEENDLAEHCLLMERNFLGFTIADAMCLAYQLPGRNGIKNQFCKGNEKAGRKWLKNFLCRHPQISLRTPEGLSLSRVRGFTPESVAQFFEIYETALDTIQRNPATLYNCDETGITIVSTTHKNIKIDRQALDIFSSICRTGISCDSFPLYGSNWTLHSSVTFISKKKYKNRN
jgi:hypothetical protein